MIKNNIDQIIQSEGTGLERQKLQNGHEINFYSFLIPLYNKWCGHNRS